jgi:hypothetical protein
VVFGKIGGVRPQPGLVIVYVVPGFFVGLIEKAPVVVLGAEKGYLHRKLRAWIGSLFNLNRWPRESKGNLRGNIG